MPAPESAAVPALDYHPRRAARSRFVKVRTLEVHLHEWGDPAWVTPERPPVVMVHGWMDVGASFQFVVDALEQDRYVIAPDWRGFGLTQGPATDNYWFGDYLGDLDLLLDALGLGRPEQPIDLVGHSMGGNIVMMYAGVCPQRIRTLVNLEGFGMPRTDPRDAPGRYAGWLHQLKNPADLKDYNSLDAVAARMQKNNPRLPLDRARWLANHWARRTEEGRWVINGDPAHKRLNPQLYRVEEVLACWAGITAPVLVVEAAIDETKRWWGDAYSRDEFHERLNAVPRVSRATVQDAGHMLHHDQPRELAELLENFWAAGPA
jgi:pimeloyl-ACP methyl ester carboxylesterase